MGHYDLVLDCTDHPTSRYLISDACVLLSKPLLSASALQTSGQLIILNSPPGEGPCYRCVFPKPPPPNSLVGCGEGGILGPVVGLMGVLQALEAVKLIIRGGTVQDEAGEGTGGHGEPRTPMMQLFGGMEDTPFRSVRMRGKRKDCFACSETSGLTIRGIETSLDYAQFCGIAQPMELSRPDERVSVQEYHDEVARANKEHVLLDVREKEHFDLCSLPGAVNIPIGQLLRIHQDVGDSLSNQFLAGVSALTPIYIVCRVGNDSQLAAQRLKCLSWGGEEKSRFIGDLVGGMKAWKDSIDPSLPFV